MGEINRAHSLRGGRAAPVLALLLLGLGGCASSGADREVPSFADRAAAVAVDGPAVLDAIEVASENGETVVRITADRSLAVHTSYRDSDGNLVVELPNTRVGVVAESTTYKELGIAEVRVAESATGERPLTRLVLRSGAELTGISPVETGLRLALASSLAATPRETDQESVAAVAEPLAGEQPRVAAHAPVPPVDETGDVGEPVFGEALSDASLPASTSSVPEWGTADDPRDGPEPVGVVASRLVDVRVETSGAATRVTVLGDGEFRFSTFRLSSPDRFVVDLDGVVNTSTTRQLQIGDRNVEQVRIGQFRPSPEPVARVVFDLVGDRSPTVDGHGDGITVAFGDEAVSFRQVSAPPAFGSRVSQVEPSAAEPSTPAFGRESAKEVAGAPPTEGGTLPEAVAAEIRNADRDSRIEWEPPADWQNTTDPAPAPRFADVQLFEAQEMGLGTGGGSTPTIPPSFEALVVNQRDTEYVGEPISMSLKNADLVETLRSFAKISDLNFVIQPGVGGSVTVELKNVPWDQALEQILRINNLGMDIEGTIVRIAPMSQLQEEAAAEQRLEQARTETVPLKTVMRAVSYATAGEIAAILRNSTGSILSQRGTVQIDSRTNTLIIRELPGNIDTVLAVIENLDTPEPQVSIEARIIEATKTFARSLGVEWGYEGVASQEFGNTTGLQFPNNLETQGGVGLLTGGANGFINLTMGNILDTFRLDARLAVAENEGLVNVVSAPRVTTLNNERASIQSGLQIPIQTVSNRTVSVQFVNATLELSVTPHVTAEGTIMLDINVAKRSPQLGLAIVGASNAPIATKEAKTQVIVRDGGTAVIGGIYEVSSNKQQDRVPGLANIPILGHLFKNRNRDDSNDELMIFITPRIVQM